MIVGLGVDLFDVARMEAELRKADDGFVRQLFTLSEMAACERRRQPAVHFALLFAAKEAIVKALAADGDAALRWPEIDICGDPGGQHQVVLHGHARDLANRRGVTRILLAATRVNGIALASAVLESQP